jgi:hypothetical protein
MLIPLLKLGILLMRQQPAATIPCQAGAGLAGFRGLAAGLAHSHPQKPVTLATLATLAGVRPLIVNLA